MAQDDSTEGATYLVSITLFKSKDRYLPTPQELCAAIEGGIDSLGIDDNRFHQVVVTSDCSQRFDHPTVLQEYEIRKLHAQAAAGTS